MRISLRNGRIVLPRNNENGSSLPGSFQSISDYNRNRDAEFFFTTCHHFEWNSDVRPISARAPNLNTCAIIFLYLLFSFPKTQLPHCHRGNGRFVATDLDRPSWRQIERRRHRLVILFFLIFLRKNRGFPDQKSGFLNSYFPTLFPISSNRYLV